MSNSTSPGLECPSCRFIIRFTIEDLLMRKRVICPSCNLSLEMSVPQEMKVHLQEIAFAENKVKEAKSFTR